MPNDKLIPRYSKTIVMVLTSSQSPQIGQLLRLLARKCFYYIEFVNLISGIDTSNKVDFLSIAAPMQSSHRGIYLVGYLVNSARRKIIYVQHILIRLKTRPFHAQPSEPITSRRENRMGIIP